jgi:alkanesulfonate monooxygenase SsuD/methylene tetrahydromethanopterin reductase-like flavin-dependent oxidoreductase (luciferase family)
MPIQLPRIGVFSVPLEVIGRTRALELVGELDELGYGCVWTGEGLGTRELFTNAAVVLGGTRRIAFGAGIANIWVRDPVTMVTAARTLMES